MDTGHPEDALARATRKLRLPRSERREKIVQSAIEEFSRRGYSGSTIAVIAAAAGCSEPTLYKHFVDKRALLLACLHITEARVEAEIEAVLATPDLLGAWTTYADESLDYRHMLMLRMLCSTFVDDEEILLLLRGATDRMLERFRLAIERGAADGTMAADADYEYATWLWLGMSLAAFEALAISGEAGFRTASATRERLLLEALLPDAAPPPLPPS